MCMLLSGILVSAEGVGSVELTLPAEAAKAELTLYRVADYDETSQAFTFCGVFENCGINLLDLEDAQEAAKAAQQLAALAKEKHAEGIAKTADAGGLISWTDLRLGYYLIVQSAGQEYVEVQKVLVPLPYLAEDGSSVYDAVLSPKYDIPNGAAILNKVDDDGAKVAKADFVLQRKVYVSAEGELPAGVETGQDVDGRFFWEEVQQHLLTDDNGQIALTSLPFGIYRLTETSAPAGFILAGNPNYFSIEKAGEIKKIGGIYTPASGKVEELTVVNRQTTVKVNKVDKNGKPVPGAKLVVKAVDGRVARSDGSLDSSGAFTFVTTEEPYELKRLPAGDYLLSEVEAPEGYRVSKDVPFTVEDGVDSVNEVTMVDEKEEKTTVSLSVTKKLVDQHELELSAAEDTFYVALFEDAERTKKVSNVQALHFEGSSSETVTFSNLEVGKTYYVGETDEFGVSTEVVSADEGVYAPVYPGDTYEITPARNNTQEEYAFENMFYDLPSGYTYVGHLTVTKKVLKGTEPYDTDETFYAAVFRDRQCTQQEGEVIALPMEGGSETSVTVSVFVGENASDSVTYYVAETDENGNVLDAASGLEYEVYVDKTEITMSPEQSSEEVTITNTYGPDETETPDLPGGNTYTGGNPSGGTSSTAARTGDSTRIVPYIILLVLAAVIVAGAVIVRRKKRNK